MPYPYASAFYRSKRTTTYPYRKYRRVYSVSRVARPARISGFYPGTRASFKKIRGFKRTPWGLIKQTYTVPEKKYNDENGAFSISDTGTIRLLNGLLLGTSATTRVGQKIMMKSVQIRFQITGPDAGNTPTLNSVWLRCMIVYDAQPNGQTFTFGDLLEDASTSNVAISPLSMANSSRFKILYNKVHTIQSQLATSVEVPTFSDMWDETYQKLNLETHYSNSNNGDIQDIRTGALFLAMICFTNGAAANQPGVTYYSRIRYYDN